MRKFNQKGFTVVEGLLTLIALVLIIFVGYYVYHAQHNADNTYNAANKDAQAAPAKTSLPSAKYLDIKELGVKFKLSDPIIDAYYVKSSGGYYYFSVHNFDSNPSLQGCTATTEDGSGVVSLVTAQPGESNGDFGGDDWTLQSIKQAGLKKVGNTYYGFQKGNGACWDPNASDAATSESYIDNVIQAFIAATPTFTQD